MESVQNALASFVVGLIDEGKQCCAGRQREPVRGEVKSGAGQRQPSRFPGPPEPPAADAREDAFLAEHGFFTPGSASASASKDEPISSNGEFNPPPRTASAVASAQEPQMLPAVKEEPPRRYDPPPPDGTPPSGWEWPLWCLDGEEGAVEVFVLEDEENNQTGRWLAGTTKSKVVDKSGRAAFLCVEYPFEDDHFIQDFRPQHVRRPRNSKTVLDELLMRRPPSVPGADPPHTAKGPASADLADLDITKVFDKARNLPAQKPPVSRMHFNGRADLADDLDGTKVFQKSKQTGNSPQSAPADLDGTKVFQRPQKASSAPRNEAAELDGTKVFRKSKQMGNALRTEAADMDSTKVFQKSKNAGGLSLNDDGDIVFS
eukprot:TRINITY_DN95498_c0_g1_i1.p1 TRINITY_DN95498_c0_g1~~TRINITY_DN95498_c0_g1_i1.p1  ORF type:complete len:383 (+),score=105.85 TRINITY_DN95498_c0_g1_i1:30-1151(+)